MRLPRRVGLGTVAVLGLAVVGGLALRGAVLASDTLGVLDADEGVVGLMARHALDGELTAFYWGQTYGGSLEPLLTAGVFAFTGSGIIALRIVPILLFAVAGALVWVIGRRTIGERGATIAVVLFSVAPAFVVWKSTRAHGFYGVLLVSSLVVVWLALRLKERVSRLELAGFGLAVGVAWWTSPMGAFLALPTIGWLAWRNPRILRQAWIAVVCALVAASPWLHSAIIDDFAPLGRGFKPGDDTYLDHVNTFFAAALPMALGLRIPYSLEWPVGELIARAVELAFIGGVVWALARRRGRPWELLVVIAAAYPFLYSLSPLAAYNLEPRYLFPFAPIIALLLGLVLARSVWLATAACVAAAALCVVGLRALADPDLVAQSTGKFRLPAHAGPALDALEEAGVREALAGYWLAYRLTFESDEEVIVGSTAQVRWPPYQQAVGRAGSIVAHVYIAGSREAAKASRKLSPRDYRRVQRGGWLIFVPRRS